MNNTSALRGIGGFLRNSLAVAIGALALTVASAPAAAADDSDYKLRPVRLCDSTGCYLAWDVVDSDEDGVADADEIMAFTDPFDPQIRPTLTLIVELAEKNILSSFEAGLGAFFVFPPELRAPSKNGEGLLEQLAAFPLKIDRAEGLGRLGVSAELLSEHGLDLNTQGLTIGLEMGSKDKGPEKRVGGIALSLISAEKDDDLQPIPPRPKTLVLEPQPGEPHEGVKVDEPLKGGGYKITYHDGYTREVHGDKFIEKDKNGTTIYDGTIMKYVNPDADTGSTVPTPEQEENLLRLRGAAIRTIEGWSAPKLDIEKLRDPLETIILVNPDYINDIALVFNPNRVTKAQPETHPDLPNPGVPAGAAPKTGGCTLGC